MIVTTTGSPASVQITGLLWSDNTTLTLVHPQTMNLSEYYPDEDIAGVQTNIQSLVDSGAILIETVDGTPINNVDYAIDESISVFTDEQSYAEDETKNVTHPQMTTAKTITCYDPEHYETGNFTQLSTSTGWDPLNRSTIENNMRDGNLTNLTYNNSAVGQTVGCIFGVDLGSPQTVNQFKMYDWTNGTYIATAWEFIGSNDASAATYDVLFSKTGHTQTSNPNPTTEVVTPSQAYRYYGVRCVTSNNPSYWVLSELQVLSGTVVGPYKRMLQPNVDFEVKKINNNSVEVKNLGEARKIKIVVVGK